MNAATINNYKVDFLMNEGQFWDGRQYIECETLARYIRLRSDKDQYRERNASKLQEMIQRWAAEKV